MKKRILSLLCVFCLMLTMLPTSAFAAGYDAPTLSIDASYLAETNQVKMSVKIGAYTDLGGLDFHVKYDKEKLKVNGTPTKGGLLTANSTVSDNNSLNPATIGVGWSDENGSTTTTTTEILTVIFDVIEGKTGAVDFSFDETNYNFCDKSGENSTDVPGAGSVTSATATIPKAAITSVTIADLDDPVKGGTPDTNVTVTPAGLTVDVKWFNGETEVAGSFAASTTYTVKIKLTASGGDNFAETVTAGGYTVTRNSNTELLLTKTFNPTPDKNLLKGSVTIDKTSPKLGDKLTATPTLNYNGETAGTLSYQWYRGDTAISSATGSSYTTADADVGKTIKVEVKNSNNSGRVISTPTAVVAAADYTGSGATAAVTNDAHRWDTKIEITNVTHGQEYAITKGSTAPTEGWRDDGVFTGLTKDTAYTVYTRVKATDTMAASGSVTTSVKTKKAMDPLVFDLSGLTSVYYYDGSAQNPSVSYKSGYTAATVGGLTFKYEKNVSGYPPVSECKLPGAYRVTIVTDNNGSDYAAGESFVGVFSISPGNLAATNFQVTGLTYDYNGNPKAATVTLKPGVDGVGAITVYYEGAAPTTSYTRQTAAPTNAGSYKVSVDVTAGTYCNDVNDLELGTLTINKVNYPGTTTFNEIVRSGQGTTGKTLTLPTLPAGASYGTITVGGTTPALISAQNITGTTLTYSTTSQANNTSATITIPVNGATNYNNYSIVVTVTAKDKEDAGVSISSVPASKTYGDGNFTLTAAKSAPGGGTWSWSSSRPDILEIVSGADTAMPTIKVKKADATGATLTVTYDSATHYGTFTTAPIPVAKKAVTVAPKAVSITKGSAIPAFELVYTGLVSGDSLTPSATPTFTCYETGTTTPVSTSTAAGSYTITWTNMAGTTFTGAGSTNYTVTTNPTTTLTISNPSYSGGGSYTPSYSITVDKTENGTITVSPKSASKGDTVTITVKPDKGYELEMLKALDKDGDALKLTEKNGKYTFKMPSGKVTVKGSFVEEAPVQIFKDVPVDAYYYEAVKWAAEKGITGGVGNGLFAPNQPCTRGQIVTFLWRAAGSPAPKNMSSFTDVPADAFYAKAVAWAVENGITGGTGDGKFSPDATCTRAQAVTFLYRAAGSPKVSGSAEFGDVATNAYYTDAVAWAAKNGITGGIGGGLFGSGNDCTRAQIVTFLYRSVK